MNFKNISETSEEKFLSLSEFFSSFRAVEYIMQAISETLTDSAWLKEQI